MQNRIGRHGLGLRLLAAGVTLAGMMSVAPAIDAQAPGRDSARAEQGMRGPRGDRRRARNPEQRIDRQMAHLTERLSLTQQQTTEIRRILTQEHEQMALVMEQAGVRRPGAAGERPARPSEAERAAMRETMQVVRTQMDSIRTRTNERIESVLTADQRTTYRELREQRPNARGPHTAHRPPRGR